MTNGGTGPYKSSLLLITSGRGPLPPSIALVNPNPPHNVTVLLDNYFGRQFNSLNDIKVHPSSGKIFFTDVKFVKPSLVYLGKLPYALQIWIPQPLSACSSNAEPGVSI